VQQVKVVTFPKEIFDLMVMLSRQLTQVGTDMSRFGSEAQAREAILIKAEMISDALKEGKTTWQIDK